MFSIASYLVLH